ncbi:MAG: hypothetical protein WKF77_12565 [Planctomycetaceae bacterium]
MKLTKTDRAPRRNPSDVMLNADDAVFQPVSGERRLTVGDSQNKDTRTLKTLPDSITEDRVSSVLTPDLTM